VISLQLNFAASARVLTAMKEDVRDEIARQQDVTHLPHMKEGAKMLEADESEVRSTALGLQKAQLNKRASIDPRYAAPELDEGSQPAMTENPKKRWSLFG
jgi:hypothetical protein